MVTTNSFPTKQSEANPLTGIHRYARRQGQEPYRRRGRESRECRWRGGADGQGAVSSVGQQADRATHAVGNRMESMGHTLREKLPTKGVVARRPPRWRAASKPAANTWKTKGQRASRTM